MPDAAMVESLTQRLGRDLFARLEGGRPLLFTPKWWDERLMSFGMDDEAVKVQLFRFVDALPALREPEDVARHLREYFREAGARLPPLGRLGLWFLPERGPLAGLVAGSARLSARRLARQFIAGSKVPEALAAIARLRRQSMAFTLDLLGEAVLTEAEADHYQAQYLDLIRALSTEVNRWPAKAAIDRDDRGPMPRVNVSLKLSSLYSQFDPIDPEGTAAAVKDRLRPIFRLAQVSRAFVNIDMEQHDFKEVTLRIFEEILMEPEFQSWPDVGIAIQAYLRCVAADLKRLAAWAERRGTPVWVRLVKGAYWDYETIVAIQNGWPSPVFGQKRETDAAYESQTRFLLENRRWLRPAIGSHNIRSIAHTLALAEALDLPPESYEFQMLYGMADPIKQALVGMGRRVRVYTPFGELLPGMAYLVRRLLENTANQSFLRASFIEHVSEEQLLMNPLGANSANSHPLAANAEHLPARPPATFHNEPLTDFSREPARQAMREALSLVAAEKGRHYPLVIAGRPVDTPDRIASLNPSHCREVVGTSAAATADHARQALAAAARAFPAWRDTPAAQRAECLRKAAEIMCRRRFELAAWEVYECGKPWREADADVAEAIDFCRYYAQEMEELAHPTRRDLPGEENENVYEPRGVAVVIAPWNFPLAILCGMTSAALVTGNPALMKPAEQSPVIAAKLMDIYHEAGVPPGVVQFLPGRGEEIGPTLIGHPEVAVIVFTGSREVGLLINRQAAETPAGQTHVKRVITEMGGKNAAIIDADADLDEAVAGVAASAFGYQGQKCSACSRAIVLESIHDAFLERLVEATRSLKIGPAEDPGSAIGPVIDEEARRRILGYIEQGKKECRTAYAAEVGSLAAEGYYVGPHIFADVSAQAVIAQEEIFGPVLAVIKARDLTQALEIANGTPYALTGGVFSRSPATLARCRREFRVGNLYLNRKITGALVDRQPFGGYKLSGVGSKAGGRDYLLQFLWPRTITENTMRHGFAPGLAAQT